MSVSQAEVLRPGALRQLPGCCLRLGMGTSKRGGSAASLSCAMQLFSRRVRTQLLPRASCGGVRIPDLE
eukprot:COSAG01_NODE_55531_length_324_cov_1.093333_1_plen_68_part_10